MSVIEGHCSHLLGGDQGFQPAVMVRIVLYPRVYPVFHCEMIMDEKTKLVGLLPEPGDLTHI